MFDLSLTLATRHLYTILDDYARQDGVCWPKQTTLAAVTGLTREWIGRCLRELVKAGYISAKRERYGIVFYLSWRFPSGAPDVNSLHISTAPDVNSVHTRCELEGTFSGTVSLSESEQLISDFSTGSSTDGKCGRCGGSGLVTYEGNRGGKAYAKEVLCGCKTWGEIHGKA